VQAMQEFMLPTEARVLLICPEISHCDVLKRHKSFHCEDGAGVLPPCPKVDCQYYGTNTNVGFKEWTGSKGNHGIRMAVLLSGERVPIVSATWSCNDKKKPEDGGVKSHTFQTLTEATWKQYPQFVRKQHLEYVALASKTYSEDGEVDSKDSLAGLIAGYDLCYSFMTGYDPPSDIHSNMTTHVKVLRIRMRAEYQHFVENEMAKSEAPNASMKSIAEYFTTKSGGTSVPSGGWPPLDLSLAGKYFDAPSITWLRELEKQQYEIVQPYLATM